MVLPVGCGVLTAVTPIGLLLATAYPLQVLRLARRGGWEWALFTVIGKFAEARGALGYYASQLRGQRRGLIEYK